MALTTYTEATDIIKTLGTNPEDRPTLTDDTFKAKFDENSANIAAFLNAMITELASVSAAKGASCIGLQDSDGRFTSTQVEAALAEIAGSGRTTETVKGLAGLISTNDNKLTTHKVDGVHQSVSVTDTGDATTSTDAPLKSAGGLAVAKKIIAGDTISASGRVLAGKTITGIANNGTGTIEIPSIGGCLVTIHGSRGNDASIFTSKVYAICGRYAQGYTITELSAKNGVAASAFTLAQYSTYAQLLFTNTSGQTATLNYSVVGA